MFLYGCSPPGKEDHFLAQSEPCRDAVRYLCDSQRGMQLAFEWVSLLIM